MIGSKTTQIALVFLMTIAPVPGIVDAADAEAASSSSRAAVRHDTTDANAAQTTATRSKGRRATRSSGSAQETVVTQNRGKRSRRAPANAVEEAPQVASTETRDIGLIILASTGADDLRNHVESAEFAGDTGALALYQLTGKAIAEIPLSDPEQAALTTALEDTDLITLIRETEARLETVKGKNETLDGIAAALGIPRPDLTKPLS